MTSHSAVARVEDRSSLEDGHGSIHAAKATAAPLGSGAISRSSLEEMRGPNETEEESRSLVRLTGTRPRPVVTQAGIMNLFGSQTQGARVTLFGPRHREELHGATMRLAEETEDDRREAEALLDLCFSPGRQALSSYRLREGVAPVAALCLLARDNAGSLVGLIRNWPVRIGAGNGGRTTLLLGPVAVHPTRQGEGLGAALILRALDLARKGSWSRVLLVGDLPYYRRFGFRRLEGVAMPPPTDPDRILGLALDEAAWNGLQGPVCPGIP